MTAGAGINQLIGSGQSSYKVAKTRTVDRSMYVECTQQLHAQLNKHLLSNHALYY